jgi:Tfp pilus assembly protein PilO
VNERNLREQLQQLNAALDSLAVDAEQRKPIDRLIADIESQLDDGTTDDSLIDQVEGAVSTFEAEYPRVAAILNSIVTTLGNIGV